MRTRVRRASPPVDDLLSSVAAFTPTDFFAPARTPRRSASFRSWNPMSSAECLTSMGFGVPSATHVLAPWIHRVHVFNRIMTMLAATAAIALVPMAANADSRAPTSAGPRRRAVVLLRPCPGRHLGVAPLRRCPAPGVRLLPTRIDHVRRVARPEREGSIPRSAALRGLAAGQQRHLRRRGPRASDRHRHPVRLRRRATAVPAEAAVPGQRPRSTEMMSASTPYAVCRGVRSCPTTVRPGIRSPSKCRPSAMAPRPRKGSPGSRCVGVT